MKPNFSESQLQQEISFSLYKYFLKEHGIEIDLYVPSLLEEAQLGWDHAFRYPYLHIPNHKGNNFFIQYKISEKITSKRGKEWGEWGREYFRFEIPHKGNDYHQWDLLKKIADEGFPVLYITNSVLKVIELFEMRKNNTLLDQTPALDIRNINRHRHVTFAENCNNFKLHSFVEFYLKDNLRSKIKNIIELHNEKISLSDLTDRLFYLIRDMNDHLIRDMNDHLIRDMNDHFMRVMWEMARQEYIYKQEHDNQESFLIGLRHWINWNRQYTKLVHAFKYQENIYIKYIYLSNFFEKTMNTKMIWIPSV